MDILTSLSRLLKYKPTTFDMDDLHDFPQF